MKRPLVLLLAVAVIVVLICVALLAVGWHVLNRDPIVHIPTRKLPSPNAYDFYMRAADSVDPRATDYSVLTPGQKGVVLARNENCLSLLRQGLEYEFGRPHIEPFFANNGKFRQLARVLRMEADVLEKHSDWAGLAGNSLDAIEFSEDVSQGTLIDMLVGRACQGIGGTGFWQAISHLRAPTTGSALRRMEAMTARRSSFEKTLEEDKGFTLRLLSDSFREPTWRSGLAGINDDPDAPGLERTLSKVTGYWQAYTVSKRRLTGDITACYDGLIARSRNPYSATTRWSAPATHPLVQDYSLNPESMRYAWCDRLRMEVQEDLMLAALALRAFYLDHGRHPEGLRDLVPRYLKRVPKDLFGVRGSLRYRRIDDRRYLLYSVGPDGKDDGGRAIRDPRRGTSGPVTAKSKGDFVAGVNR